jgi:hypothetical protein
MFAEAFHSMDKGIHLALGSIWISDDFQSSEFWDAKQ